MTTITNRTEDSSTLVRNVGHKLRSPLSNILNLSNLIIYGTEGDVSETVLTDVQEIRTAAKEALDMTDKVLELIRIEYEPQEITHQHGVCF